MTESDVIANVDAVMKDAKDRFLKHRVLNIPDRDSVLLAFESVLLKMEDGDFATNVKNGLPGPRGGLDNHVIWGSTLGKIVQEAIRNWREDERGLKESKYIENLKVHLSL